MSVATQIQEQLSLLPERIGWHILLSLLALLVGIAFSVPLAVVCLRFRKLRSPLLALASVIQTVPSLALLALMVVAFSSIGFIPAFIALVLYSVLPILRNAVTGITGVDPSVIEAARGMGMKPSQVLFKVELPLALPVIVAGIRTSAVWVVGIATLSTPVGQTSLGNYIFEGLQLRNNTAVMVGVIFAALLAVALDFLIRLLEVASERRSIRLAMAGILGLWILLAIGLAPMMSRHQNPVVVGSKTFTEQYVLAEVLSDRLRDEGFAVRKSQGMGSAILFDALAKGKVDCYVDYSGTLWTNVMKRSELVPPSQMIEEVERHLKRHYGIVCLGPLGFENTYALAMRRDRAAELAIGTIDDLSKHSDALRLGGDYEFFGRPEWKGVSDSYGLSFTEVISLDSTLMYSAVQNGQVDVIAAFSTDGRIDAYDLVVLEDPRRSFPPYDALLLVSRAAGERPRFVNALKPLVHSISNTSMRRANRLADVDGVPPGNVAETLKETAAEVQIAEAAKSP